MLRNRALCAAGALLAAQLPLGLRAQPRAEPYIPDTHISDPGASAAVGLYIDACLKTMGHVEQVPDWAKSHGLAPVSIVARNSQPGTASWILVRGGSNIRLTVNPAKQVCTIFADRADQNGILQGFGKIANGMTAQYGASNVHVTKSRADGPYGSVLTAEVKITPNQGFGPITARMAAIEHPGGPFQTLLQIEATNSASPKP